MIDEAEPTFAVSVRAGGDRTVVAFTGDLDIAGAEEAREALIGAQSGGGVVLLDLRGLRFMDSSGLRVVLEAHRRSASGGRLEIATNEGVRRVFDLSGVAALVNLVDPPVDSA